MPQKVCSADFFLTCDFKAQTNNPVTSDFTVENASQSWLNMQELSKREFTKEQNTRSWGGFRELQGTEMQRAKDSAEQL